MATDKRKKGCPNEECEQHQKKIKLKATESYCSKCGTKLIYVCAKCFQEIEDIDPKHRICIRCEAESHDQKKAISGKAKMAGKGAAAAAGAFGVGIVAKASKKLVSDAANKIVKVVENAAKNRFKK